MPDYESHDVQHTLLSYPANEERKASLKYFFPGNAFPPLAGTDWFALMPLPYEKVLNQLKIPTNE